MRGWLFQIICSNKKKIIFDFSITSIIALLRLLTQAHYFPLPNHFFDVSIFLTCFGFLVEFLSVFGASVATNFFYNFPGLRLNFLDAVLIRLLSWELYISRCNSSWFLTRNGGSRFCGCFLLVFKSVSRGVVWVLTESFSISIYSFKHKWNTGLLKNCVA